MNSHHVLTTITGILLCVLVFFLSKTLARPYEHRAKYPWSPLITGGVVVVMAGALIHTGMAGKSSLTSLAFMVFISALTLLGLLDARLKVLPNKITLPLLLAGLALSAAGLSVHWSQSLIGAFAGFMMLYLPAIAYAKLTGRDGVGYGDFKLMAAVGAWIGWQPLLYILFLSGLSVSIFGAIYLKVKKLPRTHTIPFGPFLTFFSIVLTLLMF